MKKTNQRKSSSSLRPIDASLQQVTGGTSMAGLLAGAIAGGVAGAAADEVIPLKPFPTAK